MWRSRRDLTSSASDYRIDAANLLSGAALAAAYTKRLCCSNDQVHSRGKDHLLHQADVAAEMSGKAELPLYGSDANLRLSEKLVECEQIDVVPRLGTMPELWHSGLAAAEWADFELPLPDLLC
jgi:hypothetical protein